MDQQQFGFTLTVTLPIAELAHIQRRNHFLEAALVQVLRDGNRLKEWFSIAELLGLRLPGLPTTKSGLSRLIRREKWTAKTAHGPNGDTLYIHFSALPHRAFSCLLDRVLKTITRFNPDQWNEATQTPTENTSATPSTTNPLAPQWALPLVRLLKGSAHGNLTVALQSLPQSLPSGVDCPTLDEALKFLSHA